MANKKGKYTLEEYCKLNNMEYLLSEWDYEKNEMGPADYASGSKNKAWWRCPRCSYSYQAHIYHRVGGTSCPKCRGKRSVETHEKTRVEAGNTFGEKYPELLSDWDYALNEGVDPFRIAVNHHTAVWWKGKCGHNWKTLTRNRIQGKGCPFCSNHKVLQGFNDLETLNPPFLREWDYEKNDILPSQVTAKGNRKVWWKCELGHEWLADIRNRYKCGCPYCGKKKILVGFNDLATTNPELVAEWDYEKNAVEPTQVVRGSDGFYWWRCKYGHSWRAKITNRIHGTNCPECTTYLRTSFQEQTIFYYVKKVYSDAISSDYSLGCELDIYIPSLNKAIEYDGCRWHQDINKDIRKNKKCKAAGIELIRVREKGCPKLLEDCVCIEMEDNHERYFSSVLPEILELVGIYGMDVDILRDRQEILSLYLKEKDENSLECRNPEIAKEWHPKKNGVVTPKMVAAGTQKKMWWQCKNGHEWQATVASRTGKTKTGCPICSNKLIVSGINDISTLRPDLLEIWDYEKNDILPSSVSPTSQKKVFWKCKEYGHSWDDSPYTVLKNDTKCPICGRRRLLIGFNDFETLEPELMEEWNYERNTILPTSFLVGHKEKVWWKCKKCGNEWVADTQNRRTGFKNGCPKCADKSRRKTHRKNIANSSGALVKRFPEIAKEWHPTKNIEFEFDASNVGGTAHIKVWWKCQKCSYEWKAEIAARTRSNTGCPMCYRKRAGKQVLNIDTGEIFQNARVASEAYGCTPGNIHACCKGKVKLAKGCKWKYLQIT